MKDPIEILACLLAAEEHPHLRENADFPAAEKALQESPELRARLEESKTFFAAHPVLTRIGGLPAESRNRIEETLRQEMRAGKQTVPGPWGIRKNFAWAAMLALLLAGMSVISSNIIEKQNRLEKARLAEIRNLNPREAFHRFAGKLVDRRLPLQYRENSNTQLVSWLENHGAEPFRTPAGLVNKDTMGCAYLDGPNGKVSLICFKTEKGTVHLFVTSVENLDLKVETPPRKALVNDRQALEWNDRQNAYLLITHDKGQELPEVFL